jgi:hypothetical protein
MPFLNSGWQAHRPAQFLINPDSSARVLWQTLPAELSSSKAEEAGAKKWPLNFAYKSSFCVFILILFSNMFRK